MEYKGYNAVVTYDNDLGILHGEVIDTRDVITFQGRSVDDLQGEFQKSVDDYLKLCEERGREPDRPFSGKVALRMDPETHRTIVGAARTSGKSLNTWILDAIGNELSREDADDDTLEMSLKVGRDAMEAFEEFLKAVLVRHMRQEPVSPFIPVSMWVDSKGGVWTNDAYPAHEIFRFDGERLEASSKEFHWT